MVEPHLWPANSNSTIAQTPQSLPNQQPFFPIPTNNNNTNHQLFDSAVDDDVQFVSAVGPGPSGPTDLRESIFDVVNDDLHGNDRATRSTSNNVVRHKYHTRTHTMTTRQTAPQTAVTNFMNESGLEDVALPQFLRRITVPNFAKENGIASNGTNPTKNLLHSLKDTTDTGHIEQSLNSTVQTAAAPSIANDLKRENTFGVMNQNLPGPSRVATHQPRRLDKELLALLKGGIHNRNKPGPSAPENYWTRQLPPQTNSGNASVIHQQNRPGPSRAVLDWTGQLLPQTSTVNIFDAYPELTEPMGPQTNKLNPNIIHQNPLNLSGITHQPREVFTFNSAARITAPVFPANHTAVGTKRKQTATIPIKVVRSTKQYETLIEMGFPKKDVETALRKCNLELYETIEYLSQPKRSAKRPKTDQSNMNLFHDDPLKTMQQSFQQSHDQPNNVHPEPPVKKPANLYEELLQLEETGGIVKSIESFDCEICMETIEMKDGIILRNCLHRYCNACLNGTIVYSEEISIKCPYPDCEEMIQDREIRAVLTQDEYEKFLMKGVRVAQVTISGTVLCNFPDCNGWCICEDVVNEFKCPQCKNINCIPCKAIHPGRNCREYQDDLAAGDANGIISGQRRSDQAIQDLINRNEAMKCFSCGILIMKRDGCDYIQCVMCKAGICWATRGPRYGPGGVGDLSGGCQCTIQKRCHKDCRGCH